jgi:hypothetical protein
VIEYSDLVGFGNNRMIETFIESPYHIMYSRTDITFGYNNYIIQQMITEVEDMLEENYNSEAKENLDSAKNKLSLWEKEKSTEDRNRIGREAMEYLLRAVAILKENVTGEEVQVAFLEDFPIVNHWYSHNDGNMSTRVYTGDIIESADINNPLAFWEDFQETLNETNPKVLYIFDATDEGARIDFGKCHGIDFCMIRTIDELIKNEGLDTDLNFVLYRSNGLEKIEFLEYDDIEPVVTLNKLFLDLDNSLGLLLNFNEAINNVKDNVTETSFFLPPKFEGRYTYHIGSIGPFLKEGKEYSGGFSLRFQMVIKTSIGELPVRLEVHNDFPGYPNPEYTNLIIVDELGNVTRPEEKDGKYYYPDCPSFIHLDPGQNLIIQREGDFIKITETGKA